MKLVLTVFAPVFIHNLPDFFLLVFQNDQKKSLKYDTKKESDTASLTLSSLASRLSSPNSYSR